jgi:hypothetical protein
MPEANNPLLPPQLELPTAAELEPFVPRPEHYLKPDAPHHGVTHGEETAIWAGVLTKNLPPDVRAQVDGRVVMNAAAYHDSGRLGDWRILQREMTKHGPRGAELFRKQWNEIDPGLSEEQVDQIATIIHRHTPTLGDRLQKNRDKKASRDVTDYADRPDELMLHIVQDADTLGLVRGFYSRRVDSTQRVPYAVLASGKRALGEHLPILGNGRHIMRNIRFPLTASLYDAADNLARMSRHDPDIDAQFKGHRSGAALESAQRLGIVKRSNGQLHND